MLLPLMVRYLHLCIYLYIGISWDLTYDCGQLKLLNGSRERAFFLLHNSCFQLINFHTMKHICKINDIRYIHLMAKILV